MSDEVSPGGNPIYRHKEAAPNSGDVKHADDERLVNHYTAFHDGAHMVWHELISDRVHLDVHAFAPSQKRPFYFLGTSGMSAKPMNVPMEVEGREQLQHAELCIFLPPNWTPVEEAFKDERMYWPVRLIKGLARIPHDFNSWLGWGHSIPNGDPAEPYCPDTQLTGAILIPPFAFGDELFEVAGSPPLHVFQVLPVTTKEMELKLKLGLDGMLEEVEKKVPELYGPVNPMRNSGA